MNCKKQKTIKRHDVIKKLAPFSASFGIIEINKNEVTVTIEGKLSNNNLKELMSCLPGWSFSIGTKNNKAVLVITEKKSIDPLLEAFRVAYNFSRKNPWPLIYTSRPVKII